MIVVLIKRGRRTHQENASDDRGRNWSDVCIGRGTPRIVGNHQKLEKARMCPLLENSERAWPYWYLISDY